MDAFTTASCDLDLWPPTSNQVVSRDQWLFPVSFIKTAQVDNVIWCSQDLTLTTCSDLDLWPPTSSQVISGASEYFHVSFIKMFKAFGRYRGNNIWLDKWMFQREKKIMHLPTLLGSKDIKIKFKTKLRIGHFGYVLPSQSLGLVLTN